MDAFLALLCNAGGQRRRRRRPHPTARRRMAAAGTMASEWLCEALRDIVIEFAAAGNNGDALLAMLAVGTPRTRSTTARAALSLREETAPSCAALLIHTYVAACAGCLAFMEAFATANSAAIVVSHSQPYDNAVERRSQCSVFATRENTICLLCGCGPPQ
jgi:hypothetical protein